MQCGDQERGGPWVSHTEEQHHTSHPMPEPVHTMPDPPTRPPTHLTSSSGMSVNEKPDFQVCTVSCAAGSTSVCTPACISAEGQTGQAEAIQKGWQLWIQWSTRNC